MVRRDVGIDDFAELHPHAAYLPTLLSLQPGDPATSSGTWSWKSPALGEKTVRCVAMDTTEGFGARMEVMGHRPPALRFPSAKETLDACSTDRRTVDEMGPVNARRAIRFYRPTPEFVDQETKVNLRNRIKVVDCSPPMLAAARSACSAAPRGQDRDPNGADQQRRMKHGGYSVFAASVNAPAKATIFGWK